MVIPELLRALSHQLVLEVASHNEWLAAAAECSSSGEEATGGWAEETAAEPLASLSLGAESASNRKVAAAAVEEEEEEEQQRLLALARAWGR